MRIQALVVAETDLSIHSLDKAVKEEGHQQSWEATSTHIPSAEIWTEEVH